MIQDATGNLLESDADTVVNTVNTKGVMGKGIALQFKKAFPANFDAYARACKGGEVRPGTMFVFETGSLTGPKYIFNFPTKRHWRGKSRIEDIRHGLTDLVRQVGALGVKSVAVPPLGCGFGGLKWMDVWPLMEAAFEELTAVEWHVYRPVGTPDAAAMPVRTERPRMTKGRAAVVGLIDKYLAPGFEYPVSLLEIQKLVYFLTEAGEELARVEFEAGYYGPYADVLRHVLERLDGHFIRGYGDGQNKPDTPILLDRRAADDAAALLERHPETLDRFEQVARLIEGFETPFGLELLATVHWVATNSGDDHATSVSEALEHVRRWNTRKSELMKPEHVAAAWEHLQEQGWLPAEA